ncbi:capsular polysaccharide synthesis protein [Methylomarinum vadi]|uniref:capsular polysaccharide synthesis protein n=1 Tax=Methylomarinum vadi TaxID=438855 RepID=UPI0004DF30B5|nr:capsular polysaccharide synthesis protein [Methylomarinum vadi]
MKNIWMYWESIGNNAMPDHIKLCIRTIENNKGVSNLYLLNPNNIGEFLPDLRPEWFQLKKAAHKADYIRTRLVHKYGGMWLDCDMAALNSLDPLFDLPDEYDYACQNIGTSIGCFVARPGCRLLDTIISAQDDIISENLSGFSWNGIGNELLKKFGQEYPHLRWSKCYLDEIDGGKVSKLMSRKEQFSDNISDETIIFHFCNEASGYFLRKLNENALLSSDRLVSKIFRKALKIEKEPSKLTQLLTKLNLLK